MDSASFILETLIYRNKHHILDMQASSRPGGYSKLSSVASTYEVDVMFVGT